jgi:nicotinamidase-related amidase
MPLSAPHSQLVLIDYQQRLMPAIAESTEVLSNAVVLAKLARLFQIPMQFTEQVPDKLGATVEELMPFRSHCLEKSHFDACQAGLSDLLTTAGTPKPAPNAKSLPKHLQKPPSLERSSVVLAGVEAHICLLQTALSLLEEELFDIYVVVDASSSRQLRSRDAAFDRLAGAGAELVTTEMVAYEWLADAHHPQFKATLELIK